MQKRPDIEALGEIYKAALAQAEELPEQITFPDGVTLTRDDPKPYFSGTHRIHSRFGGYGSHCYQTFHYEKFRFGLTFHTDFEQPTLDMWLKSETSLEPRIKVDLTLDHLKEGGLRSILDKAYYTMSLDYQGAVLRNDYSELLDSIDDPDLKEWAIVHISLLHDDLFELSDIARSIQSRKEEIKAQLKKLESEYNKLKDDHSDKSDALEANLRQQYLSTS